MFSWSAAMALLLPHKYILFVFKEFTGVTFNSVVQFSEEQSDLGLHCLPFRLHPLHSLLYGRAI